MNSGAFNTDEYKGHKVNGYQDNEKGMSEFESSILVGSFVLRMRNNLSWMTDMEQTKISVNDAKSLGEAFERKIRQNGMGKHVTPYYD